jgi:hypothetical protein
MRNRSALFDYSMREELERAAGRGAAGVSFMGRRFTLDTLRQAQFGLIVGLDAAVGYPTWLGEYEKSIAAGKSEEDAITAADAAVIEAQGSGGTMDVPALMRQRGIWRVLCPFMTFALNDFNRKKYYVGGLVENLSGGNSDIGFGEFAAHFALEWVLPVVASAWMLGLGRDGELPDEEDYIWEAAGFLSMGIPIARDVARFAESEAGHSYSGGKMGGSIIYAGYESLVKMVKYTHKAVTEDDDEAARRATKAFINSLGFFTGLGTPQIWRSMEGSEAYFVDEEGGPLAPFLGKPRPGK